MRRRVRAEPLHPIPLQEQDWLYRGQPLRRKPKDRHQAEMVWSAVRERMPHFPLNDAFRAGLPDELQPVFDQLTAAAHG